MKYLPKILVAMVFAAGVAILFTGCGKGNDNNNNTAAVGTCASGQVYTSIGQCGTVSASCFNGTGGIYNGNCYPANGTVANNSNCNINGVYQPNCNNNGNGIAVTSANGFSTWNGTNCYVTSNPSQLLPVSYCPQAGYYQTGTGAIIVPSSGAFSSLQYNGAVPVVYNPWAYNSIGYGAGASAWFSIHL